MKIKFKFNQSKQIATKRHSPPLNGFHYAGDFICSGLIWLVGFNYASWRSYLRLLQPKRFCKFKFKALAGYGFSLALNSTAPMISLAALIMNKYKNLIEAHNDLIFMCQINAEQVAVVALKNKMIIPQLGDSLVAVSEIKLILKQLASDYLIESVFHNLLPLELANLKLEDFNLTFSHLKLSSTNLNENALYQQRFLDLLLNNKRLRNSACIIPIWRNHYLQTPLAIIIFLLVASGVLQIFTYEPKKIQVQIRPSVVSAFLSSQQMLQLCLIQHQELLISQPKLQLVNLVCTKQDITFQYTYTDVESAQLTQLLGADITLQTDLVSKHLLNPPERLIEVDPQLKNTSLLSLPDAKSMLERENLTVDIKGNEYIIKGCLNPLSLNKQVNLGSIRLIHGVNDPKTQKLRWEIDGKF